MVKWSLRAPEGPSGSRSSPPRKRRQRSSSSIREEAEYNNGDLVEQTTETDDNCNGSPNQNEGDSSDTVNSTRAGLSATLTDPDVLDCGICYEALAPPIYQCDNGHIACSSCCLKVKNICPFCQMPIGYSRCRAFEKVLQSIFLSCKNAVYGCHETLSYSKKSLHEKICKYDPFICPFPDCGFFGSHGQFMPHLTKKHAELLLHFDYNNIYHICLRRTDKFLFLQEETEGDLFLLSCSAVNSASTYVGSVLAVNSIGSSLNDKEFRYDLYADATDIKLAAMTRRFKNSVSESAFMGHLFVPAEFFKYGEFLVLKLIVWQDCSGATDAKV